MVHIKASMDINTRNGKVKRRFIEILNEAGFMLHGRYYALGNPGCDCDGDYHVYNRGYATTEALNKRGRRFPVLYFSTGAIFVSHD